MADQVSNEHFDSLLECLNDPDKLKEFFENVSNKIPEDILIKEVKKQNESIFKLLLEKKICDVNYQDDKGNTALHHAAKLYNNEIVKLLLENGADANILNCEKMTALQMAVYKGKVQNYEILTKVTEDQTQRKCSDDRTILHLAVVGQSEEIVAKLIDDENVYWTDKWGRIPLYYAVVRDSSKIVTLLIERMEKTSNNSKNGKFFEKAVMKTVSAGQYENYLLLQGHLNETSRTIALWHAIYYDNIFFFKNVLNQDLYYYKSNIDHYEIYRKVIEDEGYEMCAALIKAGFDINATNENRNTPLHIAALTSTSNIFLLLIENGANPNAFNSASMAPICTALSYFDCNQREQNLSLYFTIKKHIDSHKCSNGCFNILRKYLKKCKFIH